MKPLLVFDINKHESTCTISLWTPLNNVDASCDVLDLCAINRYGLNSPYRSVTRVTLCKLAFDQVLQTRSYRQVRHVSHTHSIHTLIWAVRGNGR